MSFNEIYSAASDLNNKIQKLNNFDNNGKFLDKYHNNSASKSAVNLNGIIKRNKDVIVINEAQIGRLQKMAGEIDKKYEAIEKGGGFNRPSGRIRKALGLDGERKSNTKAQLLSAIQALQAVIDEASSPLLVNDESIGDFECQSLPLKLPPFFKSY